LPTSATWSDFSAASFDSSRSDNQCGSDSTAYSSSETLATELSWHPELQLRPKPSQPPAQPEGTAGRVSTFDPACSVATSSPDPKSTDVARLEEIVQCFWLVSEDRFSRMERSSHHDAQSLGKLKESVSQLLALQVECTHKTVSAADERRLIYGRIKNVEEAVSTQFAALHEKLQLLEENIAASHRNIEGQLLTLAKLFNKHDALSDPAPIFSTKSRKSPNPCRKKKPVKSEVISQRTDERQNKQAG
jgi:hypothetical protein